MTFRNALRAALFVLFAWAAVAPATAQPAAAPTTTIPVSALPAPAQAAPPKFDVEKATNAYLAQVSGPAREKSDSYFEGGYVLLFVDAFYAIAISALLLWSRASAAFRNTAQRWTRSRYGQSVIYVGIYTVSVAVLTFPLTVYEEFFREHSYGLSNQNFGQWFGDFSVNFGVSLVASLIVVPIIYAVIRATPRFWWAWGTLVAVVFLLIGGALFPVFVAPLTNHYEPLKDGPLKTQILTIAKSEGIPVTNVYEFNASKQSKRISANVSGALGTTRLSLNDNLLNRCTPQEVVAVLGHEMGHYVLDHNTRLVSLMGLVFFVGFAFTAWAFGALTGIFGGNWDVRSVDDPAGLPVLMALSAFFFLVATPVTNTISRTTEAQADIFGVNAVRQPDAFAKVTLQLSEYRKLSPSPWEEFVFYDHPSGRSRIHMMMQWKAGHLNDPDIKAGPVSPQ